MSCCPICLGECHEENARIRRIRALIVNYVKARQATEAYLETHAEETPRRVELILTEDHFWTALVDEAERA